MKQLDLFVFDKDELRQLAPEEAFDWDGEADPVNNPSHYTQGGIECIDAIKASMTFLEFAGFLKGNIIKYLWRYRNKGNDKQDLAKARWYLERLEQEVGGE